AGLSCGRVEERRDLRRVFALPALPAAEGGVAATSAACVLDAVEDTLLALGKLILEPADEQRVDGSRQAQQHPRGAGGTRARGRREDARDLGVVQPRDHGTAE